MKTRQQLQSLYLIRAIVFGLLMILCATPALKRLNEFNNYVRSAFHEFK